MDDTIEDQKTFRVYLDKKFWATMQGATAEAVLRQVNVMLGSKAPDYFIRVELEKRDPHH
jgi:hypothetical protein